MRTIYRSKEFDEFYFKLPENVKLKIEYFIDVIKNYNVINGKIAKKLINTNFYEMRISMDNEYRIILFAADHKNIMEAKNILFLNGFIKKSTKDYKKEIAKAKNILQNYDI